MENNKKEISNGVKKLGIYLLYGAVLIAAIAVIYANFGPDKKTQSSDSNTQKSSQKSEAQETKPAEKVQVYAFHSTARCYACVIMGQYAKATVDENFAPELKDGKIEFREINVDLPENREVAKKFKAVGSSLFLNAIIDGEDNIREEVQAWRLLGNKQAFSDYLSEKIRGMIGETVSAEAQKEPESEDITFYSGDNCPGCANIEKYFQQNGVRDKLDFEEKNISESEADLEQLGNDAMQCDVDLESFGVPFLWADGKCHTNEKDIIDFFKQKIS